MDWSLKQDPVQLFVISCLMDQNWNNVNQLNVNPVTGKLWLYQFICDLKNGLQSKENPKLKSTMYNCQ